MTFEQLIQHFGNQSEAAKQIGVTKGAVSQWRDTGIPELRQHQIENLTGGTLRADPPAESAA